MLPYTASTKDVELKALERESTKDVKLKIEERDVRERCKTKSPAMPQACDDTKLQQMHIRRLT